MHNKTPSTIPTANASGKHVGDGCVGPSLPRMCPKNWFDQVLVIILEFEEQALLVSGQRGFYVSGKQQSVIVNCTICMTAEARVQLATAPLLDTIVNSKWTALAKHWKSTVKDETEPTMQPGKMQTSENGPGLVLDGMNDPD